MVARFAVRSAVWEGLVVAGCCRLGLIGSSEFALDASNIGCDQAQTYSL